MSSNLLALTASRSPPARRRPRGFQEDIHVGHRPLAARAAARSIITIQIQAPQHRQRQAPATIDHIDRVCESATWANRGDDAIEEFREHAYRKADHTGARRLSPLWLANARDVAERMVP